MILLDTERADLLEPIIDSFSEDTSGFLVFNSHEGKGQWNGMKCYRKSVERYYADRQAILDDDQDIFPEDNATIIFTSGSCQYLSLMNPGGLTLNRNYGLTQGRLELS